MILFKSFPVAPWPLGVKSNVKPRGIQVSTYLARSRQLERQNAYLRAIFGHYIWGYSNNYFYLDILAPITTWIQLLFDHLKWSPFVYEIFTSDSYASWWKIYKVDPNYDAYRSQKSSNKSCFGLKYVCVYEVRCRIVALKSIFCPILRRPRLEMKRYGIDRIG